MAANLASTTDAISVTTITESLGELYALVPRLTESGTDANLRDLIVQLSRFGDTVAGLGLSGLQNVQARLMERLLSVIDAPPLPEGISAALEDWLQLNFTYLANPSDSERWSWLIEFLNRPIWNDPLSPGQIGILNRLFEMNAQNRTESHLTTPDSPPPIIDEQAANIISASLAAITSELPVLDLELPPENFGSSEAPVESTNESDTRSMDVPSSVGELITMIRDELVSAEESLQTLLQTASVTALAGERASLDDYRWQVERVSSAAEAVGLKGLHEFLAHIVASTCLAESGPPHELSNHCETLARWPSLVTKYLERLGDAAVSQALVDYIGAFEFGLPLDRSAAEQLLGELRHPALEAAMPEVVQRATQATEEMVSLTVPDDINPELLDSMLHELPAQTQEFSTALQRVASGSGGVDELRAAQRIAHTLKGSANTVGIRGIAELSHHVEDIFLALEERQIFPPKQLARVLVDSADCIEAMSEALLGIAPAPSQALEVLQEVLDWANRIDREGLEADIDDATVRMKTLPQSKPATDVSPAEPHTPERPFVGQHSEPAAAAPTLRVPTTHIDDLLRLSGESKIIGGQLKEGLRRVDTQLLAVRRQNQMLQQLVNELEQLVDVRGISMPMLRRGSSEFDALEMDQYSELHTVSRRLAEVALDSREWSAAAQTELHSMEDLLLSQSRQSNETQGAILKMRMVPATTIVGRLQRAVRQTCRLLDKQVELTVKGADTLIDSESLNQLIDPLMHLIRNAIDHGIETPEQRATIGKAAQGQLTIEFGREGNQILVRCHDDGRGLDYVAIRAAAENRGLISTDARLSDAQLARLILEAGFSTRSEVTQISGRGIGLDIVHSRVLELKGTLDVQSETGRGCRFVIRLPATLISAHALLVKHGKHTVAVASRGVRQILDAHAGKVSVLGNRLSLQVGEDVYEAFRLETLLGHASDRREVERTLRPALLIEVSADRICAVLVQSVLDTVDLVVKPLGSFVPRTVGLVGATILGDGGVAPVVDLPDLLRVSNRERLDFGATTDSSANRSGWERQTNTPRLPSVLVVDDSLSVRRSMEQLLRDSGYEVRLARDGLEAVAILESKKPDLMLVDLEMPRMNGMELTAHVRNRDETRDLPVIMITSRSTEKHRKQAEAAGVNHYMTKPYAEDALLKHMHAFLQRGA